MLRISLIVFLASACAAAGAHGRMTSTAWEPATTLASAMHVSGSTGGLCDSCIWLVKTVRCEATDPDAQAALISMVLSEVCDKLGGELAAQCSQLVPQLVPVAVLMFGSYSAKELCADMSLCDFESGHRSNPLGQPHVGLGCGMCKYLARSVAVRSGHQEASFAQACAALPAELQSSCQELAASQGEQLMKAGNLSDAATACLASGACAADVLEALREAWLPPLPAVVHKILSGFQAQLSQNSDLCDTCKLAVFEAASILGNVETQKQILEYAKQMCSSLSTYHDQCLAYVELYGPLVFNMLVQYLTPELCVTLSYCPPTAAGAERSLYVS